MDHLLLLVLAAISIHRVWIYEDVFAWARKPIERIAWLKPLYCPPCFAFWAGVIALGLLPLLQFDWGLYVVLPIAAYAPVRGAVGLATMARKVGKGDNTVGLIKALHQSGVLGTQSPSPTPQAGPTMDQIAQRVQAAVPEGDGTGKRADGTINTVPNAGPGATLVHIMDADCPKCERNTKIMTQPPKEYDVQDVPRVVHLTAFSSFSPGYSVSNVVLDQTRAALLAGAYVCVVVNQRFDLASIPDDLMANNRFMLKAVMPVFNWEQDVVAEDQLDDLEHAMRGALMSMGRGVCLTHDLLFSRWFLTHAKALHRLASFPAFNVFHVCHSGAGRSLGDDAFQWRMHLPDGHKLVTLNYSEAPPLARYYHTEPDRVVVLPNPKDLQSFAGLDAEACDIAKKAGLTEVDYAQVYPISLPRAEAKGVGHVLGTLAALKEQGRSVRLLLVDAHAGQQEGQQQAERIKAEAQDYGLSEEVTFASDIVGKGRMADGLTQQQVAALMLHANLFVFPSIAEVGPLVVLEAALAGNLLVLNSDLPQLSDGVPHALALWHPFGSRYTSGRSNHDYDQLADQIMQAAERDRGATARRFVMREYNLQQTGKRILALAD